MLALSHEECQAIVAIRGWPGSTFRGLSEEGWNADRRTWPA